MTDSLAYIAILLGLFFLMQLIWGAFNIAAELISEVLGKPTLFLLHYSHLGPTLNVPKKGLSKRSDMQGCATLMLMGIFLFDILLYVGIMNGFNEHFPKAVLSLIAIILFPYFRILWLSKKLPGEDIDKDYFQLKSPFSFIGAILKKIIGL